MKINEKNIKAAYEVADDNTKNVLSKLFPEQLGRDDRPVTERIKTFDDAVRELGEQHEAVKAYRAAGDLDHDIRAYLMLRIIAAALNEGWKPEFIEDERRWYPWFLLYSQLELNNKTSEWKREHVIRSCKDHAVAFGGLASRGASAGFVSANAYYAAASSASAYFSSRLCFKTSALAEYAGKQFINIWMDFCLIRK